MFSVTTLLVFHGGLQEKTIILFANTGGQSSFSGFCHCLICSLFLSSQSD